MINSFSLFIPVIDCYFLLLIKIHLISINHSYIIVSNHFRYGRVYSPLIYKSIILLSFLKEVEVASCFYDVFGYLLYFYLFPLNEEI